MKKWLVCILLVSLPCGCAETPHAEHGQELNLYEIRKNHPYQWVEKHHVQLTDQQKNELAQHGIEIGESEETIVYYSMTTRRGRSEVEKAFLAQGEGECGHFKLMVDIERSITIEEIHIIENPADQTGTHCINNDFLEQFIGKDLNSSFEVAKEPGDTRTTPDRIRPIKNAPITSEKIAKELRKWLVISKILKRDYPVWSIEQ
ncbi:MAG: hypothetical protein DYG83_09370 [Candidatus Brocadia sp. AMX2]|uniref:Uncharacterized protein n=1 Tax=Candidatus Brocadia sinica JPN1 TaxID=1197129 RepID=A0ABQ0K2C6_9BACT|nr:MULTISPECIES: hypothetical protein [Brocadia]KXK30747.1 MAG: hypothetical protein UZ01_01105 [Candidatus Brocadia sinica]MBC6932576.1 hypothetical protein [Candidatus Brocadia sp.]MBL1168110.1 hypothetical protein [Candidatus Brocadia sp. AMX1]NOG42691.1 hypothetical protein [Planctomycetota bacterium]KAA0243962.1 MAG: hypothetical protein EDM70_08125 [Candidatus Brocadia sp. AMX2]